MARVLKRCRSTIFRELKRNHFSDPCMPKCDGYYGAAAQLRTANRRARERKLIRHPDLLARVIERLKNGWTPEQIGNRMRHEGARLRVCQETIYRYIYSREGIRDDLRWYLPNHRSARRPRHARKRLPPRFHRDVSILFRPDDVAHRRQFGHWEGEHFFESGGYGDQWDYVLAVHDDRAHKHAHIILNNRGVENGIWFSCWAEGVMSPQLMREKQAEIAEGYGVMLDATTRLERGIFEKPAGIEEIYRAKEEACLPREIVMTAQESAIAQAQVVGFAKDYKTLADLLDRMDQRHMARAVRGMADGLGSGTPWNFTEGEIDMKDIKTVGDAIDYSERTIEALRLKAEELDPTERAAFEAKAAPIIADLSQMVPDPDLRARFGKQLEEPYPPGAGSEVLMAALQSGKNEGLRDVLERAEEVGMDSEELVARIAAGGTRNYGMAQDWVERDMNAVLAKDGLSVETANDDQLDAALEKVDGMMDALMERAKEMGVEIGRTLADEEQEILPLIDEDDRTPNPYLQDLADMLRDGKLTEEQEETVERTLQSELFKELGEEGLAELRRGNFQVLDAALPSKLDQITVTQEFLEMTFEETGDQVFTDRAAGLQQDKATEVARLRGQQEAQELGRDLGRDRGLDDEMEF